MGLMDRFRHGWNAFINNRDPTRPHHHYAGYSYTRRPDRPRLTRGNERSIITAVINKMAIDCAALEIRHVQLDKNGRYLEDRISGLNECLSIKANIDQTGRAFRQDIFMSLFDEGAIGIVPVDTDDDPTKTNSYDILSMRTGRILEWFPQEVRIRVYNERTGKQEDIRLPKSMVAIVENPFYAVMNEPNSTLQRLIRKLNILDAIDEQSGSGKLDLIIQLPYTIKTDLKQQQADKRMANIERQLRDSPFGIAYIDATEKVTQLNRPVENNLMKQIEYLTNLLYSQLGITQSVMDGSADEVTMLNYNNRTIEPAVSAVVDAMKMTFLTKTARTQGQSIRYFDRPFKLVPVKELAEIADKFTRNEILTSNEFRQEMGFKPSKDPKADELRNSNLNHPEENEQVNPKQPSPINEEGGDLNE